MFADPPIPGFSFPPIPFLSFVLIAAPMPTRFLLIRVMEIRTVVRPPFHVESCADSEPGKRHPSRGLKWQKWEGNGFEVQRFYYRKLYGSNLCVPQIRRIPIHLISINIDTEDLETRSHGSSYENLEELYQRHQELCVLAIVVIIGVGQTKEAESTRVMQELATIRNSFTSAKLSAADRKKYVWTLVYM